MVCGCKRHEHSILANRQGMPQQSHSRYVAQEVLPDIPAVAEFLPGYDASAWLGFGAPKGTPGEIVEKLNREINAALADPKMKARVAELGGTVFPTSPAEFGKFIADETEKWARVIRAAGIKAE